MSNWIETTFNVSGGITQAIAVILALAVVLLLFGLFIFILKRLTGTSAPQNRARQPRIAVMDSASVDARRRLVLIRRDNIEHLLLIGGPSDVVVEQNIVRNAPLAQPMTPVRAGAQTAPPMPGHAPVKPAIAPGPEIPPTPEDIAAQHEPAPPSPAIQARAPSYAAAPVVAPIQPPAPQPAPSAAAASVSTSLSGLAAPAQTEATGSRPLSARPSEPAPRSPAPAVTAPPVPAATADTGGGLNRAADLLRAATQNGFNRATTRPQPAPDEQEASSETTGPAAPSAPAVRAPVVEAAETQESSTSAFKSLTRPFTARDRPSYGGSITPPASGPAARAKTALLKPVEPTSPTGRIEPVVAATIPVVAATAPDAAPQTTPPTEEPQDIFEPDLPTPQDQPDDSVVEDTPEAVNAEAEHQPTSLEDESKAAEAQDDVTATLDENAEAGVMEASPVSKENAPEIPTGDAPLDQPVEGSSATREISLDINDLLEDVSSPEGKDQPEVSPAPATVPDHGAETQVQAAPAPASTAAAPAAPAPAPAGQPVSAAPVVRPPEPVKPASRPSAGLGDRNPIEEEMAKILDELGGQSSR